MVPITSSTNHRPTTSPPPPPQLRVPIPQPPNFQPRVVDREGCPRTGRPPKIRKQKNPLTQATRSALAQPNAPAKTKMSSKSASTNDNGDDTRSSSRDGRSTDRHPKHRRRGLYARSLSLPGGGRRSKVVEAASDKLEKLQDQA